MVGCTPNPTWNRHSPFLLPITRPTRFPHFDRAHEHSINKSQPCPAILHQTPLLPLVFFHLPASCATCSPASSAHAETEPMELDAYRGPAVPRRKRTGAFDVPNKTELFAVGNMSNPGRKILHERFHSELVAVRGLLQKAAAALSPPSPSSAPRGKNTRGFLAAAEPRSEEPPAKRRKASPPLVVERAEAPKKMTPAEREELASDLAELSAELPAHIVQLLQKQSRGCRGGEIVIDVHSMEGAALFELKTQLDKFSGERNPSPQEREDGRMVEEEAEEEEDVDIVGGVSPIAIAPSSPLQLAEEEEEEYVDICGDASPVVIIPQNLDEDEISGSPSSSSDSGSDSDSSSSGSDCSSDSDSASDSDDESVSSPAPAERAATPPITELIAHAMESPETRRKEERSRAREKARQELLEMERTAMSSERIDPIVLERLGIAKVQYMVSPASFLRRLGLFLKADDDDGDEDLEEGEILL